MPTFSHQRSAKIISPRPVKVHNVVTLEAGWTESTNSEEWYALSVCRRAHAQSWEAYKQERLKLAQRLIKCRTPLPNDPQAVLWGASWQSELLRLLLASFPHVHLEPDYLLAQPVLLGTLLLHCDNFQELVEMGGFPKADIGPCAWLAMVFKAPSLEWFYEQELPLGPCPSWWSDNYIEHFPENFRNELTWWIMLDKM